jgi:hypothetical protein
MADENSKEQHDQRVIPYKLLGEVRELQSDMTVISRHVDTLETVRKKRSAESDLDFLLKGVEDGTITEGDVKATASESLRLLGTP